DGLSKEVVSGDTVLKVTEGPQKGLRVTVINPAPGVGPQTARMAADVCSRLDYAGETGWRLLTEDEASALRELKVSVVPGYVGEAWITTTNAEELDLMIEAARGIPATTRSQRDFQLTAIATTMGFPTLDAYWAARAALQTAVDSARGADVYQ